MLVQHHGRHLSFSSHLMHHNSSKMRRRTINLLNISKHSTDWIVSNRYRQIQLFYTSPDTTGYGSSKLHRRYYHSSCINHIPIQCSNQILNKKYPTNKIPSIVHHQSIALYSPNELPSSINDIESFITNIEKQGSLSETDVDIIHDIMRKCVNFQSVRTAELTERILTLSLLQYKDGGSNPPTSEMFALAMNAWAKLSEEEVRNHFDDSNDTPGQRAHQILSFLWDEYHNCKGDSVEKKQWKPHVIHYSNVFHAYTRSPTRESIFAAQALLKEVEKLSGTHDILKDHVRKQQTVKETNPKDKPSEDVIFDANLVPDRKCYNCMLYLWSRHNQGSSNGKQYRRHVISPDDIYRKMKNIFQRMDTLAEVLDNTSWAPNRFSFHPLLSVCGSGIQNGGKEAEKLLRDMIQRHEAASIDTKEESLPPDSILNLLNTDEDEHEDAFLNLPDIQSYNQVLHAYAQDKTVQGAKRAEEILRALFEAYDSTTATHDEHYSTSSHQYDSKNLPILSNVAPNSVSVNSVVNAMAQIGSGEEAEKYLYFILGDDYQPDDYTLSSDDDKLKKGLRKLNIEANTRMINSVINSWIRCGTREGVERAESILDKVLRDGEDNADILPNFISFSTVIHGWANVKNGGERAQALLDRLDQLYHESNKDSRWRPSESCYNGVIKAWTRKGELNVEQMGWKHLESTLLQMKQNGFSPNRVFHNAILSAYANYCQQKDLDAMDLAMKAKILLDETIQLSSSEKQKMTSYDTNSFNLVIKCFLACSMNANSSDSQSKGISLFAAMDTFNLLNKSDIYSPNDQTYIHMFKILQSTMLQDSKERTDVCKGLLHQCCESGLLSNAVLRIVEDILPLSSTTMKRLASCSSSSGSSLTVHTLPLEWSCNRRL